VNTPFVVFDGLSKRFPDGTQALRGVSFSIARGEFCVVLGPSGSGKSTLLRAVNGLTVLDGGSITVDGVVSTAKTLPMLRRKVSMIYQQFNLVQRASVAHNVIAGALATIPTWRALLGVFPEADRRKACDLLAAVGLEPEHLVRRVSELSGGQQQRVGIARAFMNDPELILADEPVASLDPKISRDILALLKNQARARGATVLCSLHQLDLAHEFADRIVALRQGAVALLGPPSALTDAAMVELYGAAGPRAPQFVPPAVMARAS
jgi:phosphonate transport system ATP-binding protein